MSKIIVIPGITPTSVVLALLERRLTERREAIIATQEAEWKECWECGTEYHIEDQCHVCRPVVPL